MSDQHEHHHLHEEMDVERSSVPAPCPVCGSYAGATLATSSPLLAVCDVLVIRALEVAGKRIVRAERSRFRTLGTRPMHVAHTIWRPDQIHVTKSLQKAWDVVPALLDSYGCCGVTSRQVSACLDSYTSDLLITGTAHNVEELRYRFRTVLGLDLTGPMPTRREHEAFPAPTHMSVGG
jgi:hypothetical protein